VEIKITTLSENTANIGFIGEWGLSILIEADGLRILFDTGASFTAVHNAQLLGIDFSSVDKIVLSHGHWDHTGGLANVLRRRGEEVDIIGHPDIWAAKYTQGEKYGERYLGIPFNREQLEGLGARFHLVKEPVWIADNIVTSGEIPMVTEYEEIDPYLYVKENGVFKPDPLADDLAIAINTELGLIIILGCCHRGIINTIHHLREITGQNQVHCVIGGTHLMDASPERLAKTVTGLKQFGVQRLGASHCTGFEASSRMAQEFPDTFFLNNAGTQLSFP
jgi:7,8-dihydropterin-6-yl-methyl-4-(beta-D-ribofuranosyl)aminobenzene 5'-phosphate synthase